MDKKLYLKQWNTLESDEKKLVVEQIISKKNIPLKVIGVESFSSNNISIETVVMKYEEYEFVFVPGMSDVILGWDENCHIDDEIVKEIKEHRISEIEYYKSQCQDIKEDYEIQIQEMKETGDEKRVQDLINEMNDELEVYKEDLDTNLDKYIESFKKIISDSSSDVRKVNIRPMIVERNLHSVSEYNSYEEFRASIDESIFTIMTEDEYEYVCSAGKRTIFRWGNSVKRELESIYMIGSVYKKDNILFQPNMFGVHILYDSYMYELVNSKCFYKGGDGGCSICGGEGILEVLPVFSTFYRPDILEDTDWYDDKDYCYYRRIIHI